MFSYDLNSGNKAKGSIEQNLLQTYKNISEDQKK